MVSIYIDPSQFGRGYGTALLEVFINHIAKTCPEIEVIVAEVECGNEASQRLFEKASFKPRWLTLERRLR